MITVLVCCAGVFAVLGIILFFIDDEYAFIMGGVLIIVALLCFLVAVVMDTEKKRKEDIKEDKIETICEYEGGIMVDGICRESGEVIVIPDGN